jgi:hypothetical protein
VTTTLAQLWHREELPIHDGLYLADGTAWSAELDHQAPGGLRLTDPFDLEAFMTHSPDQVTSFVISKIVPLEAGSGYLCCGEGSWGSEGIFARLSTEREPIWAVYLEQSNPFVDVQIQQNVACFHSSSGVRIQVDLSAPQFTTVTPSAQ